MAEIIEITLDGGALPFTVDFETNRWTTVAQLDDGDFPIRMEARGKRYVLEADGTFEEGELP